MFNDASKERFAALAALYGAHTIAVDPQGNLSAITESGRFDIPGEHVQFTESDTEVSVRLASETVAHASKPMGAPTPDPKPSLLLRMKAAVLGARE